VTAAVKVLVTDTGTIEIDHHLDQRLHQAAAYLQRLEWRMHEEDLVGTPAVDPYCPLIVECYA